MKISEVLILFVVFIVGSVIIPSLWSSAYYKLNVVSSEQQVQMPYIEDSINYTRAAYSLTGIDEEYYPNTVELNSSIKSSPSILTMSHYQMKTSSLDHIKPNTLFAAKSMTANGVTV
jgi:uncharacterized membrane protein (UPF0182 family)